MTQPRHIASETVAPYTDVSGARAVKLFRNGANQAVRIPKEFELPGTKALLHREGNPDRRRCRICPCARPQGRTLAADLVNCNGNRVGYTP